MSDGPRPLAQDGTSAGWDEIETDRATDDRWCGRIVLAVGALTLWIVAGAMLGTEPDPTLAERGWNPDRHRWTTTVQMGLALTGIATAAAAALTLAVQGLWRGAGTRGAERERRRTAWVLRLARWARVWEPLTSSLAGPLMWLPVIARQPESVLGWLGWGTITAFTALLALVGASCMTTRALSLRYGTNRAERLTWPQIRDGRTLANLAIRARNYLRSPWPLARVQGLLLATLGCGAGGAWLGAWVATQIGHRGEPALPIFVGVQLALVATPAIELLLQALGAAPARDDRDDVATIPALDDDGTAEGDDDDEDNDDDGGEPIHQPLPIRREPD